MLLGDIHPHNHLLFLGPGFPGVLPFYSQELGKTSWDLVAQLDSNQILKVFHVFLAFLDDHWVLSKSEPVNVPKTPEIDLFNPVNGLMIP